MKILAAGDSFTIGEELLDTNNSWSCLVASRLGADLINLAEPAGSNDKIVRKVVNFVIANPVQIDLALIGWTSPGRMEFFDEHGYYDLWPGYSGDLFSKDGAYWRNDICKYISIYNHRESLYLKYLQQIILLQQFLKSYSIKYVMVDVRARDYYKEVHQHSYKPYEDQIDKKFFLEFKTGGMMEWTRDCPCGPNGHFLEEGHRIVADKVFSHIKSMPNAYQF